MAEYKLKLDKREATGKKLKNLRKTGMIPSVVYGKKKEPMLFASEYVATSKILSKAGYHSPIELLLDEKKQLAIVKNVDIDPVSRRIMNVEFKAISARAEVVATTPIVVVNFEESEAAKTLHLSIAQAVNEIDVKAKPANLPNELTIDASQMKDLEDKLRISDINLLENVEFADKELDLEKVVVSLYDAAAEAEKREAEEAAEAAEEATGAEETADGDKKSTEESTESAEQPAEPAE